MKYIYSIFLSAVSLLWMLSGCVEDPDMDTRLQKAKAPEVSETSMEGEAYASSITLKANNSISSKSIKPSFLQKSSYFP